MSSAASPFLRNRPADLFRAVLYAACVIGFIVLRVGHLTMLAPVLSALAVAAILVSLPAASWPSQLLSFLFLASGSWMLWRGGATLAQWFGAHGEMMYLLALFAVVPMLSAPVRLGGYSAAIETVLRSRVGSVFQLNCLITVLAFICGSFMSIAAVPIMMTSMAPVVRHYPLKNPLRFTTVSAICGYVLPILWTPVSGVVGVVLDSMRLDWVSLFPLLFGLSMCGLLSNWALFYFMEVRGNRAVVSAAPVDDAAQAAALPRLLQMTGAIFLLVLCIGLVERWLKLGLVTSVILVSLPYALAWSALMGHARGFTEQLGEHLLQRLPRLADQFALFLSAGFFVQALHFAGIDHIANQWLLRWHESIGTHWFLAIMPLMALVASFVGVHPLIVIALLGESLKPEVLGIAPVQLAVALIGSSVLTYMLGPFSGTLGMVQSITSVSSFRLSLWNAPYAATFYVLLVAMILLI